jgi:hypothetical protein
MKKTFVYSFLLQGLFSLYAITVNAQLLVNEINVNPPGADSPFEFVELKGTPGSTLSNMYLCVFEGDATSSGNCDLVIPLNNVIIGSNGLIFIGTRLGFPNLPAETTVIDTLIFAVPGGILENGSTTFLTVFSPIPILYNVDYDVDDDGVLELPIGAVVQDAVSWSNGSPDAKLYFGIQLTQSAGTPDAAVRFYGNNTPFSIPAWYNGDIEGNSNSLIFDPLKISSNFPVGGALTPGDHNVPNNVGIAEKSLQKIKMFPIPAYDVVYFENTSSNILHAALLDFSGRVIQTKTILSQNRFDLPIDLKPGIYVMEISTDKELIRMQIPVTGR